MLSCNFLPNYVWFGYISDWALNEEHYMPEFAARLTRGKISHDCIRDIIKELKTTDMQAFGFKNRYKFKIVVPNQDHRLYGWIEETLTDEQGKAHYLVCFGCLANHKTLKLQDPKVIKHKMVENLLYMKK